MLPNRPRDPLTPVQYNQLAFRLYKRRSSLHSLAALSPEEQLAVASMLRVLHCLNSGYLGFKEKAVLKALGYDLNRPSVPARKEAA